jgi:hypothetical protein
MPDDKVQIALQAGFDALTQLAEIEGVSIGVEVGTLKRTARDLGYNVTNGRVWPLP